MPRNAELLIKPKLADPITHCLDPLILDIQARSIGTPSGEDIHSFQRLFHQMPDSLFVLFSPYLVVDSLLETCTPFSFYCIIVSVILILNLDCTVMAVGHWRYDWPKTVRTYPPKVMSEWIFSSDWVKIYVMGLKYVCHVNTIPSLNIRTRISSAW